MRGVIHRLPRWQRTVLHATSSVLLLTGALWLGLQYGAAADALPHPMAPWLMRLHGLASFVALFMLGALAASHVPHGWRVTARQRRAHQRKSGLVLCSLAALLALSGYLLYYFAPEPVRPALGWAHALAGAAMAGVAVVHARGRRR